jgi:hypothetical protein
MSFSISNTQIQLPFQILYPVRFSVPIYGATIRTTLDLSSCPNTDTRSVVERVNLEDFN